MPELENELPTKASNIRYNQNGEVSPGNILF